MIPRLLPALLLAACSADPLAAEYPPGCRTADLPALSAEYTAALVWVCREYGSLDECPDEIEQPISDRYAARFAQWERCDLGVQR